MVRVIFLPEQSDYIPALAASEGVEAATLVPPAADPGPLERPAIRMNHAGELVIECSLFQTTLIGLDSGPRDTNSI